MESEVAAMTKQEQVQKQPFRFTGRHMALSMVAFFSVIIAVNLFMATLASSSWTGLVVKNSYVASQQFNVDLAKAREQAKRGWSSQIAYKGDRLTISVHDQSGTRLQLDNLKVSAGRPAYEQLDREIVLHAAKASNSTGASWQSDRLDLGTGIWMLQVEGEMQGIQYRRDLRMHVAKGTGMIE